MKISKIAAAVAAAALAVTSLTAVSASAVTAGATSIDFEDGDYSFVYMNVDSGASDATLSVEDYNGSKQLKVDVADKAAVPKVWFDLDKMMDRSNTVQIKKIEFDLTIVSKDDSVAIGWAGGAVGTAGGFDPKAAGSGQKNPNWSDKAWEGGAYNPGEVASVHVERQFLLATERYTEKGVNPFFGLMRWAAADGPDYVMYIDNIVLSDDAGNALPVGVTPAAEEAPAEEEAAPAEDAAPAEEAPEEEAAPAEEEADAEEIVEAPAAEEAPAEEAAPAETTAPAADTTTSAANTGNVAVASIAAVMAVAGVAAIASRKRK